MPGSLISQMQHAPANHPSKGSDVDSAFAWQRHQPSSSSKQTVVSTDLYRGDAEHKKPGKTVLPPQQPTDLYRGGLGLESSVKKPSTYAPAKVTDPWQAETVDDVALDAAARRRTAPKATAWERNDDAVSIQQRQQPGRAMPSRNPLLQGEEGSVLGGSKRRGQYNPRNQAFT